MPEWHLTTTEIESVAAVAAGRIEAPELRRQLAERDWPESDAAELVALAVKERQAAEDGAS